MWYIKNAQGDIIYLKPNKLMNVSRKEEHDVVLKNDASISKLHATITVRPKVNFKNNEPSSTVIVQDTSSKYGTFLIDGNNQRRKLTPRVDYELTATDKVKFGLLHHIFTLHYVNLITSTSTLKNNEKAELRNIIDTVDGVIVEEWKEYCTHLTVSNPTLTDQVAHALAFGTPIVKLEYWRAVAQSVEANESLPDAANFIPTINEGLINSESVSLKVNAQRRVLFKDLIFVCFSASQYPQLKNIIKCAGGRLQLFKDGQFSLKQLCSENVISLQPTTDKSQPSQTLVNLYDSIHQSLQKKKLRLIPESEIFLAILYCSIEKYCNPKFDFKRLISSSTRNENRNASSSTILAPDTEDILSTTKNLPNVIINESVTFSEQMIERDPKNITKEKLLLEKSRSADNMKDSRQSTLRNKKVLKTSFGSEELIEDDVLVINETRSSVQSTSSSSRISKCDFVNEFDEPIDKLQISAIPSSSRRFNLQSKLQVQKVPQKENSEKKKTREREFDRILDDDFSSNPFTSKDTSLEKPCDFDFTNNSSERRKKADVPKARKASSVSDNIKLPKRSRIDEDEEEENMFAFVNESAAKRRKNSRDYGGDFCELLEDPSAKSSYQEKNIFETQVKTVRKSQNKRRRSSLSSNDSSIEEEKPLIKVEKLDSEDETDYTSLIRCKKEFDSSMNGTCKSSIVPLLRKDIDLTLDSTRGYSKTFVKVYTMIPQQRIKLKNMYVWKSQDEILKYESAEELTSSDENDENFKSAHKEMPKKKRGRK